MCYMRTTLSSACVSISTVCNNIYSLRLSYDNSARSGSFPPPLFTCARHSQRVPKLRRWQFYYGHCTSAMLFMQAHSNLLGLLTIRRHVPHDDPLAFTTSSQPLSIPINRHHFLALGS